MTNPGWYPDPAGAPDTYRYWDGQSWSQATTTQPPAAPSLPPSAPTALPPNQGQPGQGYPGQGYGAVPTPPYGNQPYGQPGQQWTPTGGKPGGSKAVVYAIVGVVVLALIGVGGFFGIRALTGDDPKDDPKAKESDSTSESAGPSDSTSPSESSTIRPTGIQCTGGEPDPIEETAPGASTISGGGLTIPVPDGYLPESRLSAAFAFATNVTTVYREISTSWVSEYAVGGLPRANGFESPDQAAEIVMQCLTMNDQVYRGFTSRDDLKHEEIEVDGNPGYLITSEIRVDDPQVAVEGDVTSVVIVDTGDAGSYGFYVGVVPIGDATLIGASEDQIEAIRVN